MIIRNAVAAGLTAATLGLLGLAGASPASAASPGANCLASIPPTTLTWDNPSDDSSEAAAEDACANARMAAPATSSHSSAVTTIELKKPLPAQLAAELKAYEVS
jgi:hypothetical protein